MQGQQFYTPPLSKINKILIVSAVAVFLLQSMLGMGAGIRIESFLGLSGSGFFSGHIYQLIPVRPIIGIA